MLHKPSEQKSEQTRQLIQSIFAEKAPGKSDYTVMYAYYTKQSILVQKMFFYVVGFSVEEQEVIIITIDSDGNSGEAVFLEKADIISAKHGLQGQTIMKTSKGVFKFLVLGYTSTALEGMGILPILQVQEAVDFRAFVKGKL